MDDGLAGTHETPSNILLDELLQVAQASGVTVASAGWLDELRDFYLLFSNGQGLLFRDCLQASLLRPPSALAQPVEIGGWWTDEPSPLLASLGPEIRLLYHHLVVELGESLLRVAYRGVEPLEADPG